MTRRHYELIAHRIRTGVNDVKVVEPFGDYRHGLLVAHKRIANDLAYYFAKDNPRFNRAKFLAAAGVED